MDPRRLTTLEVMGLGVLSAPIPENPVPANFEEVDADYEWKYIGTDRVTEAVEQEKAVVSSNTFGIVRIWKGAGGKLAGSRYDIIDVDASEPTTAYRVFLLQYRKVTEDRAFVTLDAAIEFFEEMCRATEE